MVKKKNAEVEVLCTEEEIKVCSQATIITEIRNDVKWIKKIAGVVIVSVVVPICVGVTVYTITLCVKNLNAKPVKLEQGK